jgi:hypothetical protein
MEFQQTGIGFALGGWAWLALGLLAGLALWGLWAYCLARRRRRQRAARRARDRVRHANHDELVQGIQGLMLHLQAIAEGISAQDPARQQLEQLLDRADAMLLADREAPGRERWS